MLAQPGPSATASSALWQTGAFGLVQVAEHAAGAGASVEIDADLLFRGHYARDGADLVLTDPHHRVVVRDYFAGDARPVLRTTEGASLPAATVAALTTASTVQQVAETAGAEARPESRPIGRVEVAEGGASAVRNGVSVALHAGDPVYKGDVVQTDDGGRLAITFLDGTAFDLDGESRMVVDGMSYRAGAADNSALFSLVQGAITFVAGQTAKTGDMKVATPTATMGIRGTAVHVEIASDRGTVKFSVMTEPDGHTGRYDVYANDDPGRRLFTVSDPNVVTTVTPTGQGRLSVDSAAKTGVEVAHEAALVKGVFAVVAGAAQNPLPPAPAVTPAQPQSTPAAPAGGSSTAPGLVLPDKAVPPVPAAPAPPGAPENHSQAEPVARGAALASVPSEAGTGQRQGTVASAAAAVTNAQAHAQPSEDRAEAPAGPTIPHAAASVASTVPHAVPTAAAPSSTAIPAETHETGAVSPAPVASAPVTPPRADASEADRIAVAQPVAPSDDASKDAGLATAPSTPTTAPTTPATDDAPASALPAAPGRDASKDAGAPTGPSTTTTAPAAPATGDAPAAPPPASPQPADSTAGDTPARPQGAPARDHDGPTVADITAAVTAATRLDADAAHGLVAGASTAGLTVTAAGPAGQAVVAVGSGAVTLVGRYGALTVHADGSYSYGADQAAALAPGETAVDTFAFTVADGAGRATAAALALTVTGVNDAPTVAGALSATAQAGGRPVRVDLLAGAADVDHGDTLAVANLTYAVDGAAAVRLPPLGLGLAGGILTLDPAVLHLGAGGGATVIVGYDVIDGHGGSVHQSLTLTVAPSPPAPASPSVPPVASAPVLAPDAGPHDVAEAANLTGSAAGLSASATLAFTDPDHGAHTATVALAQAVWSGGKVLPAGLTQALAGAAAIALTEPGGSGSGALMVAFAAPDKAFDFLAAGETLSVTYTAGVADAAGASAQPVTFLVKGANDAPVFDGPSKLAGSIAASAIGAVGHAGGSLHFTDADLTDRPTASVGHQTVSGLDALGHALVLTPAQVDAVERAFAVSTAGTNAGTVAWTYDIADDAFAFLSAGQSLTVTSTVLLDDHHGGRATQDVAVTLAGSASPLPNAPVPGMLAPSPDVASVRQGGSIAFDAAHGVLSNDAGGGPGAALTVLGASGAHGVGIPVPAASPASIAGSYGVLKISSDGSYTYAADDRSGRSGDVQDVFTYRVGDAQGHSATATLTITVDDAGGSGPGSSGRGHTFTGSPGAILTGDDGPDTFIFNRGFGLNIITNFDTDEDKLQFSHQIFDSSADALRHAIDLPLGVVIADGLSDTLTLLGVSKAALVAHADAIHIV